MISSHDLLILLVFNALRLPQVRILVDWALKGLIGRYACLCQPTQAFMVPNGTFLNAVQVSHQSIKALKGLIRLLRAS